MPISMRILSKVCCAENLGLIFAPLARPIFVTYLT